MTLFSIVPTNRIVYAFLQNFCRIVEKVLTPNDESGRSASRPVDRPPPALPAERSGINREIGEGTHRTGIAGTRDISVGAAALD
jgi:hypothetical protein